MTSSHRQIRSSALLRDGQAATRPARFAADLRGGVLAGAAAAAPGGPSLEQSLGAAAKAAGDQARAEGWKAGHEAGHEAGYEAGYETGLREAALREAALQEERSRQDRQERSERARRWDGLMEAVLATVQEGVRQAAASDPYPVAARLAVEIAETLVGHHLQVADCAATDAVARALEAVPREADVVLRLHPDDAALAPQSARELAPGVRVRVVADPSVEAGGCVAEVGDRTVDARIGPALDRVREVLDR